ncbi:hypothetical protein GGR39_000039 [Novosphingobium fluoreni]|uniref:Twin-arginine translocation pathway signal protein n=1 Tax=Novosphingobium fluoreni TaxID=1391222 RepID=A0A7W6C0Y5_9SPHN|nr:twin-arginine translocation pathway signal protein [Novosphingobium fluoreni]MBB3938410.1 hypothetical protein [Novosphingobium fluoreni]
MTGHIFKLAALVGSIMVMASGVARAEEVAPLPSSATRSPELVPASFKVPTRSTGPGFKLVPLGPDLAMIDHAAYMSSIPHLQATFTRSKNWPHPGISAAEAMADMKAEQARFIASESFAYAVLTPDGKRERGCVYVSPSPVPGYDAVVRMWVTQAEYDAGFDARLQSWVMEWVRQDWPFRNVAYPGRTIPWATWDTKIAATKAKSAITAQ